MLLLFARAVHVLDGVFDLCLVILDLYFSAFIVANGIQVLIFEASYRATRGLGIDGSRRLILKS